MSRIPLDDSAGLRDQFSPRLPTAANAWTLVKRLTARLKSCPSRYSSVDPSC
jgi:hypothetical protein